MGFRKWWEAPFTESMLSVTHVVREGTEKQRFLVMGLRAVLSTLMPTLAGRQVGPWAEEQPASPSGTDSPTALRPPTPNAGALGPASSAQALPTQHKVGHAWVPSEC